MSDSSLAARRARFAANVERLRRERGMSHEELCERSELDRGQINAILNGDTEARVETIYLIAGALGVEPGELFVGVRWIPPAPGGGGEYRVDDPEGG